jgi:hypothetical protein
MVSWVSIVYASTVRGQKEADTWYFGNKMGFDFSAGAQRPLTNNVRKAGSAYVTLLVEQAE